MAAPVLVFIAGGCSCYTPGPDTDCRVCTFDGEGWDALIDNPQYMGPLLYPNPTAEERPLYRWFDSEAGLYSQLTDSYGDGMFWGGGIAVSNYADTDLAACNSYESQLTVWAEGAHSGSNFAVINGYKSSWSDCRARLAVWDGPCRIDGMYICLTAYACAAMMHGDGFNPPLAADRWVKVVATGVDGYGREGDVRVEQYLFRDGAPAIEGWTFWPLEALGMVSEVRFDFEWNGPGGADAFMYPAYLAIDDIAITRHLVRE